MFEDLPGSFSAGLWNALAIGLHVLISLGEFNSLLTLIRERLWNESRPGVKRLRDADLECCLRNYCANICAVLRDLRGSHDYREVLHAASAGRRLQSSLATTIRSRLNTLSALSQLLTRQAGRAPPIRADSFEWTENNPQTLSQNSSVWSSDSIENIRRETMELHERLSRDLKGECDASESDDSEAPIDSKTRFASASAPSTRALKRRRHSSTESTLPATRRRSGEAAISGAGLERRIRSSHNSDELETTNQSSCSNIEVKDEGNKLSAQSDSSPVISRQRSHSSHAIHDSASAATSSQVTVKFEQ